MEGGWTLSWAAIALGVDGPELEDRTEDGELRRRQVGLALLAQPTVETGHRPSELV